MRMLILFFCVSKSLVLLLGFDLVKRFFRFPYNSGFVEKNIINCSLFLNRVFIYSLISRTNKNAGLAV